MDVISYNIGATANGRIEKFIKNPDSNSGIVTVPKVIGAGESVTIPAGRVAVLPNVQVDGTLTIEGEVFIPSGATFSKVVETEGNQTIADVKTFTSSPIVPTPTTGTQAANKDYVDNEIINDVPANIHNATAKTTPADNDELALLDSASSFGLKKFSWLNIKNTIASFLNVQMFSGRMRIGGGADDTVNALQVNGSIRASNVFTPTSFSVSNANFTTAQYISNPLEAGTYIVSIQGFSVTNVSYYYTISALFSVHPDAAGSTPYEILNIQTSSYNKLSGTDTFRLYFGESKRLSITWGKADLTSCTANILKII